MKINKLLLLSFIYCILFCFANGQISYKDITPLSNLIIYPDSPSKDCIFSLYYLVDPSSSGVVNFQQDQIYLKSYKYYNATSIIYQLDYPLSYGSYFNKNFNITADWSNDYIYTKSIALSCLGITPSTLSFEIITPLKYINSNFESIIKVNGLRESTVLKEFNVEFVDSSKSSMKLLYGSYYLLQIDSPPSTTDYTSDWIVNIVFKNSNVQLPFKSPLPSTKLEYSAVTYQSNALSVYSSSVSEFTVRNDSGSFIFFYYSDNITRLSKQPIKISGNSTQATLLACSENIFNFINNPTVSSNQLSFTLITPNVLYYSSIVDFNFIGTILIQPQVSIVQFGITPFGIFSFGYKDTIDSPVLSKISFLNSNIVIARQLEFPYGLKSLSGPVNEILFVDLRILDFYFYSINYDVNNLNSGLLYPSTTSIDTIAPVIVRADIKSLRDSLVYIEIEAKDDPSSTKSGIRYIIVGNPNKDKEYSIYGFETLVSGDINNGIFAIIYDTFKCSLSSSNFGITLIDNSGNLETYKLNSDILSNSLYSTLSLNFKYFDPLNDIKSVFFLYNNVDVTNNGYDNSIYIYAPNLSDTGISIYYEIQYTQYRVEKGFARYNSISKLFEGSFYLPQNLPIGIIPYRLSFPTTNNSAIINSIYLNDEFQLRVSHSLNFDTFGPYFTEFITIQLNGFQFTIKDDYNGFKSGYFVVRGEIDRSIFNFTIQLLNDESKYLGTYQFYLPPVTDPCVEQIYWVTDVYLEDSQGYVNQFHRGQIDSPEYQQLNPFFKFSNSITTFIPVSCASTWNPAIDVITLESVTITPSTIDVLSNSRNVLVEFTIKDINILKSSQLVYVYLTSDIDVIKFEALLGNIANDGLHSFSCRFDVPYGFGISSPMILISIHGLISNKGFITMFSSNDINSLGYPYSINIDKSVSNRPNILYIEPNPLESGNLTLVVTNPSSIQNITVRFDMVVQTYTNNFYIKSASEINIKVQDQLLKQYKSASVYLQYKVNDEINVSGTYKYIHYTLANNTCPSNCGGPDKGFCINGNQCHCINGAIGDDCLGTPAPTPTLSPPLTPSVTNPPQLCKGTPLCGGPSQGECKSNGCICKLPYFGLDCSSKSIEITEPTKVNENTPEVKIILDTNNDGSDSSSSSDSEGSTSNLNKPIYSSSIGILYLREIDINSKVVNIYNLDDWVRTNLNNDNNSTKYQYDITITNENDSSDTNIKAVLEFYKQDSKVIFADQQFTVLKSSIKYAITISKYSFKSQFNTLELLMFASIESSNINSACSRKEFGDSTSDYSNYIKLQVEDHSWYGRFLKRAVIDDNNIINITNKIINQNEDKSIKLNSSDSSYKSQSIISISIPQYSNLVIIDPDFSVLLDSRSASKSGDSQCLSNNNKSLTTPQLAGIIIACAAFVIVGSAIGGYVYYNKSFRARIYVHKLKSLRG